MPLNCRGILGILLVIGSLAVAPEMVCAQTASDKFWSPQGETLLSPREQRRSQLETSTGYLFLDGQYIPPPYIIEINEGKLFINGEQTEVILPTESRPGGHSRGDDYSSVLRGKHSWGKSRHPEDRLDFSERNFERRWSLNPRGQRLPASVRQLADGNVVVLFSGSEPICLDCCNWGSDLLHALIDKQYRATFWREVAASLVPTQDHARWREWFQNYLPPDSLVTRAMPHVQAREDDLAAYELRVQACDVLERWNYPLNVSAVLLILVSGVHLLASAPFQWGVFGSLQAHAHSSRPLALSLVLVIVLSVFDLVWTMLLSQAGMMIEVNPLAKLFIHEPLQLIAFKSFFTFGAIGIMASLRRFRPAQIGAWWACLICTLLATRWVAFHTLGV